MKYFLLILFLILASFPASASYITLSTNIFSEEIVAKEETQLEVELINSGDETAYQTQINFLLPSGVTAEPIEVGNLRPNLPFTKNVTLKINQLAPGSYVLGALTSYQDANGYPFSALSFSLLNYRNKTTSSVFGIMQPLTLPQSKKLILTIRNLGGKAHQLKATLFLPRELSTDSYQRELHLGSKEEKELSFEISSLGALPKSNYLIFAVVEYQEELHYSSLARGMITIASTAFPPEGSQGEKKDKGWLKMNLPFFSLLLTLIILLTLFLYLKFKEND